MPSISATLYASKPSITTLRAAAKKAAARGETFVQLTWGENEITLEKQREPGWRGPWEGHGWIGRNGGDDLAQELNEQLRKKFNV